MNRELVEHRSTASDACLPDIHGVIWISGYSASGKTTVGRKVAHMLEHMGARTVFLDGDDLRSIFAGRWGYAREDRVELARIYFRLASHLASQSYTVVISAIAMYDEVRAWLRENVPNAMEVYLDVPEEERLRRDQETRKLYGKIQQSAPGYDAPDDKALRLRNHNVAPEETSRAIIESFLGRRDDGHADYGRDRHWRDYYKTSTAPRDPSPYARAVAATLSPGTQLIEVGCGNGRDACFFASEGHIVTAVDRSEEAVATARDAGGSQVMFLAGTLPELSNKLQSPFDVAYSRFVIHAMPRAEEDAFLDAIAGLLRPGGRLFIECRSINDPMSRIGEIISPTERILGHYRRFIVLDELRESLIRRGFVVEEEVESTGLAVHGDEDPMIIRVTARNKAA